MPRGRRDHITGFNMSLFKYFNERGGNTTEHRGPLSWSRTGDLPPLRNCQQAALTEAEVEAIETFEDFHCKTFELWDEAQLKEYCEVCDRMANGWYRLIFIDRRFSEADKSWRVLLEWSQIYGEIPNSKVPPGLRGPIAPPAVGLLQAGPHALATG